MNPSAYPSRPAIPSRSRDEVKVELAEAIRMGDIPISDTGLRPRDTNPSLYPREPD